jgi:hypothetical protein
VLRGEGEQARGEEGRQFSRWPRGGKAIHLQSSPVSGIIDIRRLTGEPSGKGKLGLVTKISDTGQKYGIPLSKLDITIQLTRRGCDGDEALRSVKKLKNWIAARYVAR